MHLTNPPATLEEAIAQLTELTQQLEASRRDFNEWFNECQTARRQRDDAKTERDAARQACRLALNAFERNDAIDWAEVEKHAAPKI